MERGAQQVPAELGGYRLERLLGEGGMGAVYAAVDPRGRRVALKLLALRGPGFAERFAREAAVQIRHPNVVERLDAGVFGDGTPYLALELLEGMDLARILAAGPLPSADVIEVGVQACAALEAVHAAGLIHRDLKPANLFVTPSGCLKLLDFGIAQDLARRTRLTQAGGVLGTPSYVSPEQARGERELTPATDLWSLGVVLYECLAGRPPFDKGAPIATVLSILADAPLPLAVAAPGTPAPLAAVVERALAKPLAERWSSAAELRRALESARSAAPEHTPPARLLPADEERMVGLLLAAGVREAVLFERQVLGRGGLLLPAGDRRLLGVFGVERWHGDEVDRALAAALEVRPGAERVVVASGRASSGASPGALSGEAIEAAERGLLHEAPGVLVTAAAFDLLRGEHPGRPISTALYQIERGQAASASRERAPLVGREHELAVISADLAECCAGPGAAALVVQGPAGGGRSRLRREIERVFRGAAGPRTLILGARASSHQRDASFSLLAGALRQRLQQASSREGWPRVDPDAPLLERRRALRRLAQDALPPAEVEEAAAFLGTLLGVPVEESGALSSARLEPRLMADRLRVVLHDLLRGLAEAYPLVLSFENLEWADEASLALLAGLRAQPPRRPLLIVFTSRSDLVEPSMRARLGPGVRNVVLPPLPLEHGTSLARAFAGVALGADAARRIAERAGGNPFFLEQLVLSLRESGSLERPSAEWPLPPTVAASVQSRLDLLPSVEREVLKRAALFARRFSATDLSALSMVSPEGALESLTQRGLLARRRGADGAQYWFESQLVREAAYRLLAPRLRSALHLRTARRLQASDGSSAEEIGRHLELGGAPELAAGQYADAALAAAGRGESTAVLRLAARALSLGPGRRSFELHLARAQALRFLGRRAEQGAALALAQEAGTGAVEQARSLAEQALLLARTRRGAEALPAFEAAVAAARRTGDRDVLALALGRLSAELSALGRPEPAEAALAEAERAAAGAGPFLLGLVAGWRAQLASARGELSLRKRAFANAARLYREAGDLRLAASAESNLADLYNRLGDYAAAERALDGALESCRRVGHRLMEGYVLLNLGYARTAQGRPDDALEALRGAALIGGALQDRRLGAWVALYRARALIQRPAPGSARPAAALAVAEAERAGLPALRVSAQAALAEAELGAGQTAAALEASARAVELLARLRGMEEDEAYVYWVRARCLEAAGDAAGAASVRARGRALVHAQAEAILEPELRDSFLRRVPANRELLEGR